MNSIFNSWELIEPIIIADCTRTKENCVKLIIGAAIPFQVKTYADLHLLMMIRIEGVMLKIDESVMAAEESKNKFCVV